MADRPNRVGQQLGNYRLISLLGEGGFAEVYLGEHIHLGTKAAVKVLHTQLTSENVDAFRTEARTIAHLVHPHIVRVLDFGVEGTTPFLVMDYAPHGTLRNLHPKGSSLAVATIVTYIKQVADALQYAHDEKLIHRDIKPENMLVGQRNEVFLSDFGIALVAQSSRHQSTQEVIGTVTYMSPEQIQGKPRPASDQYSLGIVVYEWLCGDRPFHGSFTELCTQHMFAPPPPLREKVPAISPDIEYVVMTALAKDPKQRFASVRAFATALEQASRLGPSQQGASPRGVTPPSEPLPLTVLATPPHRIPELTTEAPPPNLSSQGVASARTEWQVPQPKRFLSRRTVMAGLATAGVIVTSGGILWWILSPHPLYTYRGHSDSVDTVAWSPDGKRIASASSDTTVQVWDAIDGSRAILVQYCRWHGPLMASASPPAPMIRPCRSGMLPMAIASSPTRDILIHHTRWHGPPMVSISPPALLTKQCKSGMLPMAAKPSPIRVILINASPPAPMTRQSRSGMPLTAATSSPTRAILAQ